MRDREHGKISYKKGFVEPDTGREFQEGGSMGQNHTCNWINWRSNDLRRGIKKIFDPKETYLFVGVKPSLEAIGELPKWVSQREWEKVEGKSERVYKIKKYNQRKHDSDDKLSFGESLLESYLKVIDKDLENEIGKDKHIRYNLLKKSNDIWMAPETVWPTMFVLPAKNEGLVAKIVEEINNEKNYQILKEIEHPQNYQMSRADILKNKKISPLVVVPEMWKIEAPMLQQAMNFLLQFNLDLKPGSNGYEVD